MYRKGFDKKRLDIYEYPLVTYHSLVNWCTSSQSTHYLIDNTIIDNTIYSDKTKNSLMI